MWVWRERGEAWWCEGKEKIGMGELQRLWPWWVWVDCVRARESVGGLSQSFKMGQQDDDDVEVEPWGVESAPTLKSTRKKRPL